MKNNSVVSIIIPIYNGAKYLNGLFESIDKQKYLDYEVILVDDGSNDDTAKTCMRKVNQNKKYKYYYKENSGVSDTRNFGIKKSTGKYICFVDADDRIADNYLYQFMDCIENTEKCIVCCDMQKFNNEDNIKYSYDEILKNNSMDKYELLFSKYAGYIWNKIYSRDIIMKHKIEFDTSLGMCEDMVFNFKYLRYIKNCICISNKNYYYRISLDSASKSLKNVKWYTIFNSFDAVFDMQEQYNKNIYNKLCYSYLVNLYQGVYRLRFIKNDSNYKSYKQEIKKRLKKSKKLKYSLSHKDKIKLFFYKYLNYISFTYKIKKENNV